MDEKLECLLTNQMVIMGVLERLTHAASRAANLSHAECEECVSQLEQRQMITGGLLR